MDKLGPLFPNGGNVESAAIEGNSVVFLTVLKLLLPYDLTAPLLVMDLEEWNAHSQSDVCFPVSWPYSQWNKPKGY